MGNSPKPMKKTLDGSPTRVSANSSSPPPYLASQSSYNSMEGSRSVSYEYRIDSLAARFSRALVVRADVMQFLDDLRVFLSNIFKSSVVKVYYISHMHNVVLNCISRLQSITCDLGETYLGEAALRSEIITEPNIIIPLFSMDSPNKILALIEIISETPLLIPLIHLEEIQCIVSSFLSQCLDLRYAALERRMLEAILAFTNYSSNIDEMFSNIIQYAHHLSDSNIVELYLVEPTSGEAWLAQSSDVNERSHSYQSGVGCVGRVAQERKIMNLVRGESKYSIYPTLILPIPVPQEERESVRDSEVDRESSIASNSVRPKSSSLLGFHRGSMAMDEGYYYHEGMNSMPVAILLFANKADGTVYDEADERASLVFANEIEPVLKSSVVLAMIERRKSGEDLSSTEDAGKKRTDALKMESAMLQIHTDPQPTRKAENMGRPEDPEFASSIAEEELNSPGRLLMLQNIVDFERWDIEPWKLKYDEMENIFVAALVNLRLFKRFNLVEASVREFVVNVKQRYRNNPFHSFYHAFGAFHVTYMMLRSTNARNCLYSLEILACLIAALCHDVDHPGNNNAFEAATMSDLAIIHSDDAILERHHAHLTFQILKEHNCLSPLIDDEKKTIRRRIIRAILATDMSRHRDMCQALLKKTRITRTFKGGGGQSPSTEGIAYNSTTPVQSIQSLTQPHRKSSSHMTVNLSSVEEGKSAHAHDESATPAATKSVRRLSLPFTPVQLQGNYPLQPIDEGTHTRGDSTSEMDQHSILLHSNTIQPTVSPPMVTDVSPRTARKRAHTNAEAFRRESCPEKTTGSVPIQPPISLSVNPNALPVSLNQGTASTPSAMHLTTGFFDRERVEDREMLVEAIIHSADLSGQVLPTYLAVQWGDRVMEEFERQANLERELNLPVSFVLGSTKSQKMKGQMVFISQIVAPLWECMEKFFPELRICVEWMRRNVKYYEKQSEELEQQESIQIQIQINTENPSKHTKETASDASNGNGNPTVLPAASTAFTIQPTGERISNSESHSDRSTASNTSTPVTDTAQLSNVTLKVHGSPIVHDPQPPHNDLEPVSLPPTTMETEDVTSRPPLVKSRSTSTATRPKSMSFHAGQMNGSHARNDDVEDNEPVSPYDEDADVVGRSSMSNVYPRRNSNSDGRRKFNTPPSSPMNGTAHSQSSNVLVGTSGSVSPTNSNSNSNPNFTTPATNGSGSGDEFTRGRVRSNEANRVASMRFSPSAVLLSRQLNRSSVKTSTTHIFTHTNSSSSDSAIPNHSEDKVGLITHSSVHHSPPNTSSHLSMRYMQLQATIAHHQILRDSPIVEDTIPESPTNSPKNISRRRTYDAVIDGPTSLGSTPTEG